MLIRNKISVLLGKIPTRVYCGAVVLMIMPAYLLGWQILTEQATCYVAIISKVTVNLLLLFFFVGMWVDKATKHMPRWKGWAIWAVVTILLILFFKYVGGMETRF